MRKGMRRIILEIEACDGEHGVGLRWETGMRSFHEAD